MKIDSLKKLIREEIKSTLKEATPKYKQGDTFLYGGAKHEVISDDGFIIQAKSPSGKTIKLNYAMLNKSVNESESTEITTDTPLKDIQPGRYKINFISLENGGPNAPEEEIVDIKQNDDKLDFAIRFEILPINFWKKQTKEPVYKIEKITKL